MYTPVDDTPDLELALLRRGVGQRTAEGERCEQCQRTPLFGERIYLYERGTVLCELCRSRDRATPASSRVVHGPAFGVTIRLTDRRVA